jgi:tryptophan-rich sensory protein
MKPETHFEAVATVGPALSDPRRRWLWIALAVVPILLVSTLGSEATRPHIPGWYAGLTKPWFNPPNWAFPVAWTLLFTLMAVSVWRIWRLAADTPGRSVALGVYHAQLALNGLWSFAFFAAQSPLLGLVVILPFLALILLTIRLFGLIDDWAARLLWPYAAWVAFATLLNGAIFALN